MSCQHKLPAAQTYVKELSHTEEHNSKVAHRKDTCCERRCSIALTTIVSSIKATAPLNCFSRQGSTRRRVEFSAHTPSEKTAQECVPPWGALAARTRRDSLASHLFHSAADTLGPKSLIVSVGSFAKGERRHNLHNCFSVTQHLQALLCVAGGGCGTYRVPLFLRPCHLSPPVWASAPSRYAYLRDSLVVCRVGSANSTPGAGNSVPVVFGLCLPEILERGQGEANDNK